MQQLQVLAVAPRRFTIAMRAMLVNKLNAGSRGAERRLDFGY